MRELFVCEKPSQAMVFAEALCKSIENKNGYFVGDNGKVFTYAYGHLVKCVMPEKINPEFGWKGDINALPFFIENIPLEVIEGKKKQYDLIVKLMRDAEIIYIATDAGREGEHIFRKIYKLSGLKKELKRLWVQDMTANGIRKAYANAKDAKEYEGLALAGRLREESDLLIGLNATQLLTRLSGNGTLLSLGRVQTPTLAMIVRRDEEIENFKKTTYYTVIAPTRDKKHVFELVLDKDTRLTKERAEEIIGQLKNRRNFKHEEKVEIETPKKLFDLTSLQMHMNKKAGWTAQKTLDVTQKLYEKGLVTYPRTNSQYLASDEEIPFILDHHKENPLIKTVLEKGYSIEKTFINPEKVSDHEAIIITSKVAENLQGDEKTLYHEIFLRFVAAFFPKAEYLKTTVSFEDGGFTFKCEEKALIKAGWRELYNDKPTDPKLRQISIDDVLDYEIKDKVTNPPKRYTEETLLNDMKNAGKYLEEKEYIETLKAVEGIGTPATRASIIELLLKRGYIERKGKHLVSTKLGRQVIHMMPDDFSLYSPRLTAYFETMLLNIEKGVVSEVAFYKNLRKLIEKIAEEIRQNTKKVVVHEKEVIAKCPKCGHPMYENSKGYYCSQFKEGCRTTLWKNGLSKLGKRTISKKEAHRLLSGQTIKVKLKSKKGVSYEGTVRFNVEKNWVELIRS